MSDALPQDNIPPTPPEGDTDSTPRANTPLNHQNTDNVYLEPTSPPKPDNSLNASQHAPAITKENHETPENGSTTRSHDMNNDSGQSQTDNDLCNFKGLKLYNLFAILTQ